MNCEDAALLISARLDHEIRPADRDRLEEHLRECPNCAATAEAFALQDAQLHETFAERRRRARALAEEATESLPPRREARRPREDGSPWPRRVLAVATAAALAGVAVLLLRTPMTTSLPPAALAVVPTFAPGALTPRARPAPPPVTVLARGESVRTGPGERRRLALPDGSLLYVNENTSLRQDGERRLALAGGEVFVEVAPRVQTESLPFVVETARRTLTALGTRFAVRSGADRTGVYVLQGQVRASDRAEPIGAGRELGYEAPEDGGPVQAPRGSHLLAWTRDLMAAADSPLVPGSSYAGGALVAVDPSGQQARLSLRKFHVDVHIEDGFARTTIDQTYFNHANSRLEGTFYFPLPPEGSLARLAMYVDGQLMEGGMVERNFGRQVYERIVTSQRDPALLEWVDGSTFKMRVFPLEARQEKRIVLSYTQKLPADYNRLSYRFPAGHSLEAVRDWSFHARVKGGAGLAAGSPSHPAMKIAVRDGDLLLDTAERDVRVDRDVALELSDPASGPLAERARLASAEWDGRRYLMLRYRPELPLPVEARTRRDWVFLFEASGDRDPLLARVQVEVVRHLLTQAEPGDTFAVLAAGTQVRAFSPELQPVTPENVQAALAFLDGTHLIGALDLGRAFAEAQPYLRAARSPYLVHLGSGVPALGERRDDLLARRLPPGTRYVGVGVGKKWNRALMKAAAEQTGGYVTQINPDESLSWRGFELATALNLPRLMDVRVTDDTGRAYLLTETAVAHGEEVCAVARLDGPRPAVLTVVGKLDGQPFRRDVPVRDVAGGAGYVPRTWARLEIDRLLAEDPARHRETIVALSKAAYVMSPFTSLLVLESDAMYREFKVDRGRKDHWAMYPCPDTIPVVYEPDPNSPRDPRQVPGHRPNTPQVLQTILVRVPPRCLTVPGAASGPGGPTVTALQWYSTPHAASAPANHWSNQSYSRSSRTAVPFTDVDVGFDADMDGQLPETLHNIDSLKQISVRDFLVANGRAHDGFFQEARLGRRANLARLGEASEFESLASESPAVRVGQVMITGRERSLQSHFLAFSPDGRRLVTDGLADGTVRLWDTRAGDSSDRLSLDFAFARTDLLLRDGSDYSIAVTDRFDPGPGDREASAGRVNHGARWGLARGLAEGLARGQAPAPRLHARPSFSADERLFSDLASYAPGLSTRAADVLAVLEAEAAPRLADLPGRTDPEARRRIDRARADGWRSTALPGGGTLTFDGRGRYVLDRVLPAGLRERTVCDGDSLWQLYPELGLGARRAVSRFHRAEPAEWVPWLLPPAEDLARGADVAAPGDDTVTLSPPGAVAARTGDGRPVPFPRTELVFAPDGRLAERRQVLCPEGKVLSRETYAPDGTVTQLDGRGKELSKRHIALTPAAEPDLRPDTARLVVLPLPARSREHVYPALGLTPGQNLDSEANRCFQFLRDEDILTLLATDFAAGQPAAVRRIHEACFLARGDRRIGFFVLRAACGDTLTGDRALAALLREARPDPAAVYLSFLSNPRYRDIQSRLGLHLAGTACAGSPFLATLAAFRDHVLRWQFLPTDPTLAEIRQRELDAGLAFARRARATPFAWALLGLMQDRTPSDAAGAQQALARGWGHFADNPGLAYAARYEQARCLLRAGHRPEARAMYEAMFARAIQARVLPALDGTFREALQGEPGEADRWSDLMRRTAARLAGAGQRLAAVALAWQCWQLGDQPLAINLLGEATRDVPTGDRLSLTLAAIAFQWQTGQQAAADARLGDLLQTDDEAAKVPSLWRLAAQLAEARGDTARSVASLEQALELESRDLPEVIDLEGVRRDYGRLLEHYRSLAEAARVMRTPPPADLLPRAVRAADRWRALDRDAVQAPCQAAANVARLLGAGDLAWDYLTTPVGRQPNESGPWLELARTLAREGQFTLADRAYAAAFAAEPTNPQVLWDRAQNLRQAGEEARARGILREIVDGDWQPSFSWVRGQARWQLEGR